MWAEKHAAKLSLVQHGMASGTYFAPLRRVLYNTSTHASWCVNTRQHMHMFMYLYLLVTALAVFFQVQLTRSCRQYYLLPSLIQHCIVGKLIEHSRPRSRPLVSLLSNGGRQALLINMISDARQRTGGNERLSAELFSTASWQGSRMLITPGHNATNSDALVDVLATFHSFWPPHIL